MAFAERNLPLSAALAACISLFGLPPVRSEEISIPGVEEGGDVLRALAIAFGGAAEGRIILVPPHTGAGGAVADVIADRASFARINRPLLPHEREAGLTERAVFDVPILLIAHPELRRSDLSMAELSAVLSGQRRNWLDFGLPEAPLRVVIHGEAASALAIHRDVRRADVKRAREVEDLVRQVQGAIGFTTAQTFSDPRRLVLTLDGKRPEDADYPLRVRIGLAYKAQRLSQAATAFLDFLGSARAEWLISAQGARPIRP